MIGESIMKIKKMKYVLAISALLCLASCSGGDNPSSNSDSSTGNAEIYAVYEAYVSNGGTLSYEDWLASIKGEKGDKGDKGDTGEKGEDGKDGTSIHTGIGAPSSSLGQDGDSYIDTSTWDYYTKSGGSWSKVGNLKGQDGADGSDGDNAPHAGETFTVTYHLNGGTLPSGYEDSVLVNWGDTLDLPIPTCYGREFMGWFTGYTVNDKQFYSSDAVFSDLNLYAEYAAANTYIITVDLNGGTLDDGTTGYYYLECLYGGAYSLPSAVTKEGYNFTGYTLNGGYFPATGPYFYESDITVIANYEPISSGDIITLTVWGGETYTSIDYLAEVGDAFTNWMAENYPSAPTVVVNPSPISEASVKDRFERDPTGAADFAICYNDQLEDLIDDKYVYAIDDFSGILDVDDIKTRNGSSSDVVTFDGKMYGFPISTTNGYFLYYDADKINLEDCATFDTLLAAIDEASTRDGVTYRFGFPTGSGWYIDGWWRGCGYDVVRSSDGTNSTCDWNSTTKTPTGVEVASAMLNLTHGQYGDHWVGAGDSTLLTYTPLTTQSPVIAWVSGIWNDDAMKENWTNAAATVLPDITIDGMNYPMKSVAGLKVGIVNALSENAAYAALFGNYLTSKDSQILRYEMLSEAPTNIEASSEIDYGNNYAVDALVQQVAHASFNQNVGDGYWTPAGTLARVLYNGINGETSLIDSGDYSADLVINETALQTLLDETVASITGQ